MITLLIHVYEFYCPHPALNWVIFKLRNMPKVRSSTRLLKALKHLLSSGGVDTRQALRNVFKNSTGRWKSLFFAQDFRPYSLCLDVTWGGAGFSSGECVLTSSSFGVWGLYYIWSRLMDKDRAQRERGGEVQRERSTKPEGCLREGEMKGVGSECL